MRTVSMVLIVLAAVCLLVGIIARFQGVILGSGARVYGAGSAILLLLSIAISSLDKKSA